MSFSSIVHWSSDVPKAEEVERSNRLREACKAEANTTGNVKETRPTWPAVMHGRETVGELSPDDGFPNISLCVSWAQEFEVVDMARKEIPDSEGREFNAIIKARAIEFEVRSWIISDENKDTVLTSEMISKFRRDMINLQSIEDDCAAIPSQNQCIDQINESEEFGPIYHGEINTGARPTRRSLSSLLNEDIETPDTPSTVVPPGKNQQAPLHRVKHRVQSIDLRGGQSGSNTIGHNETKAEDVASKTS